MLAAVGAMGGPKPLELDSLCVHEGAWDVLEFANEPGHDTCFAFLHGLGTGVGTGMRPAEETGNRGPCA